MTKHRSKPKRKTPPKPRVLKVITEGFTAAEEQIIQDAASAALAAYWGCKVKTKFRTIPSGKKEKA